MLSEPQEPVHSVSPARAAERQDPIIDFAQMILLSSPPPTASWVPSGHQSLSMILVKGTQPCLESSFLNELISSVCYPERWHRALEHGWIFGMFEQLANERMSVHDCIPRLCLICACAVLTYMDEPCRESGAVCPLQVHGASVAHAGQADTLSSRGRKLGHEAGPWLSRPKPILASPPSIPLLNPVYTSPESPQQTLLLAPASSPVLELIKLQADCGLQVCEPVPALVTAPRGVGPSSPPEPLLCSTQDLEPRGAHGVVPVPIKGWAGE